MIWESIVTYLSQNSMIDLLSKSKKSQPFMVADIKEDYVKIQFSSSQNTLKLEKSRFISAYEMLKENKGKWVRIGASRIDSSPDTLEGRIKNDFNGRMNGLSTAPWIATILVNTFDDIVFNEKKKGQALMMVQ